MGDVIMILCIDTKHLKTSPEVQKDFNLEDLILNHTKYYDSSEEALKDQYAPLDFSVSVRSMYSNLVLEIDKGEEKRYYTNLTDVEQFIHKGYDLIMYLSSIGVLSSVNYSLGFDEIMVKHSQFSPIGLYNPDASLINPIIYTHIILSDEGAEELKKYLKEGRQLVPISEIKSEGNIKAVLDTLIEVKEKSDE